MSNIKWTSKTAKEATQDAHEIAEAIFAKELIEPSKKVWVVRVNTRYPEGNFVKLFAFSSQQKAESFEANMSIDRCWSDTEIDECEIDAKFSYVNANEDGSLTSVIYRLPEIEKHPDESEADFKARAKAHFRITDAD